MKVMTVSGFPRGGLPGDIELLGWDAPGEGVVFAVPEGSEGRERLADLPDLEVVQVLSAGYEWIAEYVPAGVTLCNAGDTRSPAVHSGWWG